MRIVQDLGGQLWIVSFVDFLRKEVFPEQVLAIITKNQNSALVMIRVLRHYDGNQRYIRHIAKRNFDLTKVPLEYVGDLKWYAKSTDDTDLLRKIEDCTTIN